jgi:hypothetical protein
VIRRRNYCCFAATIASAIDHNEATAGVFLDLSKAFDTSSHEILFSKLSIMAFVDWH